MGGYIKMEIQRILNNNAAIVLDNSGREQIVCGRGIAYKKRSGQTLDASLINQVFTLRDEKESHRFEKLFQEIPYHLIEVAEWLGREYQKESGQPLNDNFLFLISDHLLGSIKRLAEEKPIVNPFLWDIKHFYEKEYQLGQAVIQRLAKYWGHQLPDDEAGFLAMHLVNAQSDNALNQTIKNLELVHEITTIVKMIFKVEFAEDSNCYYRFVTHLKFFAQRVLNQHTQVSQADELLPMLQLKYTNASYCVDKISHLLQQKYQYQLSAEDNVYLILHVNKIIPKQSA